VMGFFVVKNLVLSVTASDPPPAESVTIPLPHSSLRGVPLMAVSVAIQDLDCCVGLLLAMTEGRDCFVGRLLAMTKERIASRHASLAATAKSRSQ